MTLRVMRRALAGAGFALLLAACAHRPAFEPAADDALAMSGRLAMRVEAHDSMPAHSVNAMFELRGDAEHGELQLTTPIGTTIAQARWRPGQVSLTTTDGSRDFASLDAMATEALGEAVPLAALFDWLRGRPWPGADSRPALPDSRPGFTQLGWLVDLTRVGEGWISVHRARPPQVNLRVILDAPPKGPP